jgi:hypothetical protein
MALRRERRGRPPGRDPLQPHRHLQAARRRALRLPARPLRARRDPPGQRHRGPLPAELESGPREAPGQDDRRSPATGICPGHLVTPPASRCGFRASPPFTGRRTAGPLVAESPSDVATSGPLVARAASGPLAATTARRHAPRRPRGTLPAPHDIRASSIPGARARPPETPSPARPRPGHPGLPPPPPGHRAAPAPACRIPPTRASALSRRPGAHPHPTADPQTPAPPPACRDARSHRCLGRGGASPSSRPRTWLHPPWRWAARHVIPLPGASPVDGGLDHSSTPPAQVPSPPGPAGLLGWRGGASRSSRLIALRGACARDLPMLKRIHLI